MNLLKLGIAGIATTVALTGCAGTPAAVQTVTVSASPSTDASSPESATPSEEPSTQPPAPSPTETVEKFVMPKVTGMVLQTAQDLLQSKGSYLMDQQDASGLGRIQVLDSNWKVCTQKPKAGAKVPIETIVVLGAVKLDEKCP